VSQNGNPLVFLRWHPGKSIKRPDGDLETLQYSTFVRISLNTIHKTSLIQAIQTTDHSQMTSQVYLISGAARGIGYELSRILTERPNTIVFAGVRDVSKATALNKLAAQHDNLHVIKLDSHSVSDAKEAAQYIDKVAGGLDVVIANAGVNLNWDPVATVSPESLEEHFRVNTIGPLILFQAVYPVLLKHKTRKVVTVSSLVALLGNMLAEPETSYGVSKVALNFVTKRIHVEHSAEGFIAFPIHPGLVGTEMGNAAAPVFGMSEFPTSPVDSATGILAVVDKATPEYSGRFWNYDGTENSW